MLTAADAAFISLNENGDLAAAFRGHGVWRYKANTFQEILPFAAQQVLIDDTGNVVGDFGTNGLWRYTNAVGWGSSPLSRSDADIIAIDPAGDAVAGFPGLGLFLYDNTGQQHFLSGADPSLLARNGRRAEHAGPRRYREHSSLGACDAHG
jgi:hypothetical protein